MIWKKFTDEKPSKKDKYILLYCKNEKGFELTMTVYKGGVVGKTTYSNKDWQYWYSFELPEEK